MVTFTYNNLTLQLRNPDFGNKESLEQRRIYRKTRGGDLEVFRDTEWPVTDVVDYSWTYLKEIQVYQILGFLRPTLGQVITMVDYEGRTWTGIIITPAEKIIQAARENTTFTLQFQGSLS